MLASVLFFLMLRQPRESQRPTPLLPEPTFFDLKAERHKPALAYIVHIGGHIAFDIHRIAQYCRANQTALIEDCAHAVGAEWNGVKPGAFGDAGIFSLYATKTIPTGEGGVEVIDNPGIGRSNVRPHSKQSS